MNYLQAAQVNSNIYTHTHTEVYFVVTQIDKLDLKKYYNKTNQKTTANQHHYWQKKKIVKKRKINANTGRKSPKYRSDC